jgi:predicted amidohydrolase
LIVLPEIWNSPYAVTKFREYAERVPEPGGSEKGEGETVSAMREMAREAGCWLIGGESATFM